MSEVAEPSFRTKTGKCTITVDHIILTREGNRGVLAGWIIGDSIGRILLIYGLLGILALVLGVRSFLGGNTTAGLLLALVGTIFVFNVIGSRNNSATPVIDRSAVRAVEAHPPRPPATRGYFTVLFEEKGRIRKRLIMLPGSMENGKQEYDRAEALMLAAGLLRPGK